MTPTGSRSGTGRPRGGALAATLACIVSAVTLLATAQEPTGSAKVEAVRVRPNVYMIAVAGGGNVAIQVGEDGVLAVGAGSADNANAVLATVKSVTTQPIRYVINLNADPDHVGGNQVLSQGGRSIFNVGNSFSAAMTNNGAAGIIAYETVLLRMSKTAGAASAYPVAAWPTDTHATSRRTMYFNNEGVELLHQPAAHSDADMIAFFRGSDVIVAGDVIEAGRFPHIDTANGGTIQGELDALNRIVDLAIPPVPFYSKDAATTYIIPGHGRVLTHADVVDYRDMVTIIRDRVRALKGQGMTLEQVQAAAPARGWAHFGTSTGPWTTNMFIEAIYRGVNAAQTN